MGLRVKGEDVHRCTSKDTEDTSRWDSNILAVNRKLHKICLQKYEFSEMLSKGCFSKEIFSLSCNLF